MIGKPKSMQRAKHWSEAVEEGKGLKQKIAVLNCSSFPYSAYRFQLAGYRDEMEYLDVNKGITVRSLSLACAVTLSFLFIITLRLTGGCTITL